MRSGAPATGSTRRSRRAATDRAGSRANGDQRPASRHGVRHRRGSDRLRAAWDPRAALPWHPVRSVPRADGTVAAPGASAILGRDPLRGRLRSRRAPESRVSESASRVRCRYHRRGLPDPQRLDPEPHGPTAGHGLDPRRRVHDRRVKPARLRRRAPRRRSRRGDRHHQLPARRARVPLPRRRRAGDGHGRQRRPPRPARRPGVGADPCGGPGRRSVHHHGVRRVRGRGVDPAPAGVDRRSGRDAGRGAERGAANPQQGGSGARRRHARRGPRDWSRRRRLATAGPRGSAPGRARPGHPRAVRRDRRHAVRARCRRRPPRPAGARRDRRAARAQSSAGAGSTTSASPAGWRGSSQTARRPT